MINLNALKNDTKDRPIAVFGLGISGMASVKALTKSGFEVLAYDDNPQRQSEAIQYGARILDLTQSIPSNCAYLVLSPGVPLTHPAPHPVVVKALQTGIEILSDIELFHRAKPHAKTIGITGTNGKSTTTALIGHILKQAGYKVEIGGNLGKPVLQFDELDDNGFYVIELSSYQLDLCPTFRPTIGILLNISSDHLDRHGGIQGYAAAKSKIFTHKQTAICSIDDPYSKAIFETLTADKKIAISLDHGLDYDLNHAPALKGAHNLQNAQAAILACSAAGLDHKTIQHGLNTFAGLEHRQKNIRSLNKITFVNDSKATNDEASARALSSFENIYWICGGKPKDQNYPACMKYFSRIKKAYCIGEAAPHFIKILTQNNIPAVHSKIMHAAVFQAYEDAVRDIETGQTDKAVILLSPACASFDQFLNFEQRGMIFKECVDYLPRYLPPIPNAQEAK